MDEDKGQCGIYRLLHPYVLSTGRTCATERVVVRKVSKRRSRGHRGWWHRRGHRGREGLRGQRSRLAQAARALERRRIRGGLARHEERLARENRGLALAARERAHGRRGRGHGLDRRDRLLSDPEAPLQRIAEGALAVRAAVFIGCCSMAMGGGALSATRMVGGSPSAPVLVLEV